MTFTIKFGQVSIVVTIEDVAALVQQLLKVQNEPKS